VYWDGPVYEVRRGLWFLETERRKYTPCDDNMAEQLENGYKYTLIILF
jgi:hypothetical protein